MSTSSQFESGKGKRLPTQDQPIVEREAKLVCRKCKAALRRRTPGFFNQLTSFYPYTCSRCGNHQKKFRLTMGIIWPVLFLCLLGGAAFWFWRGRPGVLTDSLGLQQQDQAEALARARATAGGQLSAFEQMMLSKPKASMDNATVLKLVKAGVSKDIILQMIRTSNSDYDVTANAIIELKEAGVDQAIILAMISASYGTTR